MTEKATPEVAKPTRLRVADVVKRVRESKARGDQATARIAVWRAVLEQIIENPRGASDLAAAALLIED